MEKLLISVERKLRDFEQVLAAGGIATNNLDELEVYPHELKPMISRQKEAYFKMSEYCNTHCRISPTAEADGNTRLLFKQD